VVLEKRVRRQLLPNRVVAAEERGGGEELVGLLVGVAAQRLHEACGYRVRVKMGARPVEEVALTKGRPRLLEEAGEVRLLPHGAGPLPR
jgi:hypothetical protein